MGNVWKLGTRWDDRGVASASVLSIMRRNNTAFVWLDDDSKEYFLRKVKKGDYIALADGYQIVAIGKATGDAQYLRDFKNFTVSEQDYQYFSAEDGYDNIVAVKINIVDIEEEDKATFYYQKRGKFCAIGINQLRKETKEYYEQHVNRFAIQSYTGTVGQNGRGSHALLNSRVTYIIPVYQRPYEWTERQVRPFINDIMANYMMGNDGSGRLSEPMFIGTMQLSRRKPISKKEYQHDVIDGQQRITTLTVFLKELQKHYPGCERLSSLKFGWLQTHVSDQQDKYLHNYLNSSATEEQNPYSQNAKVVWDAFEAFISNQEEKFEFNIEYFCDYLFHQVCFVVIETSAGLSKTLQIFNTINNSGLDLNGSDLFKIRMYEYLRDVKNEDEEVFEKIQELYTLIDTKNKSHSVTYTMGTMLDLYKNILITEYNLNNTLYSFGWETFFDRLFDSLLGINEWEHFKTLNGLELSLDTLRDVIEMRYEKQSYKYAHTETDFAANMIWRFSRYSMSKGLVTYPFLYFFRNDENRDEQLERLIVALNKYFFIHSIEHSKQIYMVNSFVANLVKSIKNSSSEDIIQAVVDRISKENQDELRRAIGQNLIDGSKWWKYLVCGVSTYLEERKYTEELPKIFDSSYFDIEHIHANADEGQDIPYELQNSIGNLTHLEYQINRKIKDKPFKEKREFYKDSKYRTILNVAQEEKWDLDSITRRREDETNKIYDYITKEKELSYSYQPAK